MDVSALHEFLASITLYSKNCDDCNTIKTVITCCLQNFDQKIVQDLLLHHCEHALEHDDKISAEKSIKFYFKIPPQNALQFGRALLLQATVICPDKFNVDKFKLATDCLTEVLHLNKNSSLSKQDSAYLNYACCATFWQISRKFMQRAIRPNLKPMQKLLYVSYLVDSSIADVKWKFLWGLYLMETCFMTDDDDEAIDIWKKMESFSHQVPVSYLRYFMFKMSEVNKHEKLKLPPKFFEMDAALHSFVEVWNFKYTGEGGKKDISLQSRTLTTENTDDKFSVLAHSVFTPKENLFTSEIDRYEILKELFYVCFDMYNVETANKCLKNMNNLELNPEPLDKDILKIILKEMNKKRATELSARRQQNMVAIGKAYRSLQKQMDSNSPATIQAGCVLLWNLCLQFIDRSTREQIYPSFVLIENGLDLIESNYTLLTCQLSMEMAKCDLFRGDYRKAEKHWKKAIKDDLLNSWEDLLQIRILHCSVAKSKAQIRPLNCEEQIIYNLYELMSLKPKNALHCRAILLDTANAMTDDLFGILLYSEQWPLDVTNEEKWLDAYKCAKLEIPNQCENLSDRDDKRKFLFWARITKFALEYNIWDICSLAAKFCMATKIGLQCQNNISSLTSLANVRAMENDYRICVLVNLNFTRSLIAKLHLQNLSITNADDNSAELQHKISNMPSTVRTAFSEVIKNTCCSIISNLKLASTIGVLLREPWIVIISAQILWNCIYNIQKDAKLNQLAPLMKSFQKQLKASAPRRGEILLINFMASIAHLSINEMPLQPPATSRLVSSSITTNIGKEINEMCEDMIHHVYNHHRTWDQKLLISFQSLVKVWLKLHQILDVKIDQNIFSAFQDEDKKAVNLLIYVERLKVVINKPKLEDEEEVSLEKAITLTNECQWVNPDFHLNIWSILADLAYVNGFNSEFQLCYEKAFELESKITDYIDENYKCLCMLMCINAELIFKSKSNCVSKIEDLDLYIQSAKKSVRINNYHLFSLIMKLMWNIIFPILKSADLRIVLRRPLTDIVDICLESLQHILQTKRAIDEDVCVNFLEQSCYMVNGVVQVLADKEELDLARNYLEHAVSATRLLKFPHEICQHLKFLLQVLNTDKLRVAKSGQYSNQQWAQIARYNKIPEIQNQAAYNAVIVTEEISDNVLDRIFSLLSFSEYLSFNENSDNNLSLANTILANKMILEFMEGQEASNPSISTNLTLICVLCQLIRYYKRGSTESRSLVKEAGDIILNIWQEISSNNTYIQELQLLQDVTKWTDLNIHLHIPITLLWDYDNADTKNTLESIQKCLQFLNEEMDWLHYHVLMLPVTVLKKIFLYNINQKEKILLVNLKLLKLCSDLNLTQKAADLHSTIFHSMFSAKNATLDLDTLEQIRYINSMRTNFLNQNQKENNLPKSTLDNDINFDLLMAETKELLSLGYIGLAIIRIKRIFNFAEAKGNDILFGRAAMLLAELELFSGNYEAAKDLILRNQRFVTDEEEALAITLLYLDTLVNLKHKNWKAEIQSVLKETEIHFNNLSAKYPQKSQFCEELLLQLQIRGMEILVTHCNTNIDEECSDQIQFLLQRALDCIESGWIKYSLQIFNALLKSFMVNPVLQKSGYDHPLCIMLTTKVTDAANIIEEFLTEDVPSSLTKLLPDILPLRKELLDVKINLANLTALLTNSRISDIVNIQATCKNPSHLLAEKYVYSLPPWNWEEAADDYIISLEEIIASMRKYSDDTGRHSIQEIQELFLAGKSLLLAAKYMASVNHCSFPDVNSHPSPLPSDTTLSGINTGSIKAELFRNLNLNIKTQAAQYFTRCIQQSKFICPDLASDAVLNMVDCCMASDTSTAVQYLLWYQSFEMNAYIRNCLLQTFSNPFSSILASVLHQQKYINGKGLGQSPLYIALEEIAKEECKFWEVFGFPGQNFDLQKLIPTNINVLIILQHSKNRDLLYGAMCFNDGIEVARTQCSPADLNKLLERQLEIQEEWFNIQSLTKHFKNILISPQVNNLFKKFRNFIHALETYLSPILSNFARSQILRPNTSEEKLQQTTILLLADTSLQCFPLEAITFFQRHFVSCCIVRDFSIQFHNSRHSTASTTPPLKTAKADRKTTKSKPSGSDATSAADVNKLCYVIEDEFDVETKTHVFGESIIEYLTSENIKTEIAPLILGDSNYISGVNWGQSETSRTTRGWICVASPQLSFNLVKTRLISNSSVEPRISVIMRHLEKFTSNEKFNFVFMALLLTLAGFSTIVIDQWIHHKSTVKQNICAILKEMTTNWKGAAFAVNEINGVTRKNESGDDKNSSNPSLTKHHPKWKSDKFITRTDNENEFHMTYLDNSLVCYGLPNTLAV